MNLPTYVYACCFSTDRCLTNCHYSIVLKSIGVDAYYSKGKYLLEHNFKQIFWNAVFAKNTQACAGVVLMCKTVNGVSVVQHLYQLR